MPLISEKLKPEFEIGDVLDNKIQASNYSLFFYIAQDSFCFAMLENESNRFVGFKYYDLSFAKSLNETLSFVTKIIGEEKYLKDKSYKQVVLAAESRKNLFIPQAFFDEQNAQSYFDLNFDRMGHEDLFFEKIKYADFVNLYSVDSALSYFIKNNFPTAHVCHYISGWLTSLLLKYKDRPDNYMFVNILNKTVNVCVIQNGKMIFYNTFQYFNEDDIMYFMMNVIEQLKLDTYTLKTELSQHGLKQLDMRNILSKYLRDIKFVDRTSNHIFSFHFNSVPAHYFPVIFDLSLCV
ncbi:MAG: DUF3822 family protein [Bacteroidetes bacterium]|nr:DUF3822 family protein [Bacteroidota bacterium]MBL0054044.1 DUF3822 family protein [Bacteroidota bacterium]